MKKNYILLLTLAFGLFLRIYRLEELAGFDFDQEKAAFWIRDFLIHGKISLIGQEISTGGIFIGPLYFYLLSPFYFLLNMRMPKFSEDISIKTENASIAHENPSKK